ncbi:c-type cytochrome [Nitratiruptor sp. SB155-2]|uniref:c-type cytochrome n=1 Tax=Nitratiruptor sp. (strain SB155-2) TaxID=387092 RepID=UPI0001587291|nr:c-type cytochrome [Nitratiruptor sp. SB155-2]BAF70690.1 ubiquinol cytochrome c oxidoreductase, cytochrome c1 subunit [Nitratiruptor sp. SB155-2]
MNKELKILAIIIVLVGITYWGIEPYAHSKMHPHHEPATFKYEDLKAPKLKGDPKKGAQAIMNNGCTGCHSIKAAGIPAPMDPVSASASYGVNPPDLSNIAAVTDEKFLAAFIKHPVHAFKLDHKYKNKPFPMPDFFGSDQDLADIVAYLKSIAKPQTPKGAFEVACGRCHNLKYDGWTVIGEKPKFKNEVEKADFELKLAKYEANLKKYLGTTPPDLSMYIRSRGHEYIRDFVEDPQKILHGTAMPRVGLTEEATMKVIEHLEKVGDRKKEKRNHLGIWILGYFVIFAILAYLWKQKIWRELH